MAYALALGKKLIRDILNPAPLDIDVNELWPRLAVARRFSNNPNALTVLEHVHLVKLLAVKCGMPDDIYWWCLHHDDHEAIITDIPGPLKSLIAEHTDILNLVEQRLDECICHALLQPPPTNYIKKIVHVFDKMAETIEWRFVLHYEKEPWNLDLPFSESDVPSLLHRAKREAHEAVYPPKRAAAKPKPSVEDDDLDDDDPDWPSGDVPPSK